MPERLLAKSRQGERTLTLAEHCGDTGDALVGLFAPGSRCLSNWMRFFRLADETAFLRDAEIACLFHDIGKANGDFLAAVERRGDLRQAIRHEHLSGLVLCLPGMRTWLEGAGCDWTAILAGVLSHHAKVSDQQGERPWAAITEHRHVVTFLQHPEITALLTRIGQRLKAPCPVVMPADAWPSAVWDQALERGWEAVDTWNLDAVDERRFDPRRNHLLAVKAAVIAADAMASGLWRESRSFATFLAQTLHGPALSRARIEADILNPRINQLTRAGKWRGWSDFQTAAGSLGDRAAIMAGCGAGKTLAAWRWAADTSERQPVGSVIFLYPTRATATEGFKDYVAWAPEGDAVLLTGTASLDLAGMRDNPPESLRGATGTFKQVEHESDARLFALGNWKRRYFSATLDQFLSFLEHGYSGLCLLPQLADAALIIDEAHSLDQQLFSRLLALLTHFSGPVLLMSATLPRERLDALRALGVRLYPDDQERAAFADLAMDETRPRYRLLRQQDHTAALATARDSDRVTPRSTLWVVNTVKRCQLLARDLRHHGLHPLVYHSRFRPCDRRQRHQAVIAAFQTPGACQWAVTTQVCEMSLDLDADRLISEDAPLPSLIQRLGRANRKRISHDPQAVAQGWARDPAFRAEVITYAPPDQSPYHHEDEGREAMAGTAHFCTAFDGQEVSQRALAEALIDRRFAPDVARPLASAGFITGGLFATAKPLRGEDEGLDVRCVLSTDLAAGLTAHGLGGEPLEAWTISIPKRHVLSLPQRHQPVAIERPRWLEDLHLHIADGTRYDADLGFLLIDTPE